MLCILSFAGLEGVLFEAYICCRFCLLQFSKEKNNLVETFIYTKHSFVEPYLIRHFMEFLNLPSESEKMRCVWKATAPWILQQWYLPLFCWVAYMLIDFRNFHGCNRWLSYENTRDFPQKTPSKNFQSWPYTLTRFPHDFCRTAVTCLCSTTCFHLGDEEVFPIATRISEGFVLILVNVIAVRKATRWIWSLLHSF